MSRTLVVVLAGLMVAGVAYAGIPDAALSQVYMDPGGLATCPDGDGPAYQYITVNAKDSDTNPIPGIPYSSFFFEVTGGDVTMHAVDPETDTNGDIRFEVVGDEVIIYGTTLDIVTHIYTVILDDEETLDCNTFDLAPTPLDDYIGLQDFIEFSAVYGTIAPQCDFNWDGLAVGLQDFILFSAHYGHGTPPPGK